MSEVKSPMFHKLQDVYTTSSIHVSDTNKLHEDDIDRWAHLRQLNINTTVEDSTVMLLIGQDHSDLLIPREVIHGEAGAPYATRTHLGWTVNGQIGTTHKKHRTATSSFVTTDTLQNQLL